MCCNRLRLVPWLLVNAGQEGTVASCACQGLFQFTHLNMLLFLFLCWYMHDMSQSPAFLKSLWLQKIHKMDISSCSSLFLEFMYWNSEKSTLSTWCTSLCLYFAGIKMLFYFCSLIFDSCFYIYFVNILVLIVLLRMWQHKESILLRHRNPLFLIDCNCRKMHSIGCSSS